MALSNLYGNLCQISIIGLRLSLLCMDTEGCVQTVEGLMLGFVSHSHIILVMSGFNSVCFVYFVNNSAFVGH